MKLYVRTAAMTLMILLSACGSLLPQPPPPPALHDFGPIPTDISAMSAKVVLADVEAPAWLARNEIHYRLLYSDATQLHSYAGHRWVAPPAELCAARLRELLGTSASTPDYSLRVKLSSFEQDFSAPDKAYVSLTLTAELHSMASGQLLAVHEFHVTAPATPNVQGAIGGLSALANRTLTEVTVWAEHAAH